MRISDWSSDVCSSDLPDGAPLMPQGLALAASEWAKIGEFVRGGGKIDGKPLVDALAFGEMFEGSQAHPAYGLTWWLPRSTPAVDIVPRSDEHTSELQSLMRISYAVICLKKTNYSSLH